LARSSTIADLRLVGRRHTPKAVFDYVDGAAEDELSLTYARAVFRAIEFTPSVLRDVSAATTETSILGRPASMPLVFAPTGFTRLMHHEGEPAVARAAQRAGIPYALSTVGTTTPEAVAAAAPTCDRWFQLYLWRERERSLDLIRRAAASGFTTLVLTVDTPVPGARLRDVRNGFTIPPSLTAKTMSDIALHPGWWFNLLTTEPLTFVSPTGFNGAPAELIARMFNESLDLSDLEWVRDQWPGNLVVKGIQNPADAIKVVDRGVQGIVVSNHGGRQLDRTATPIVQLPAIVEAVGGRVDVLLDGGIMSGSDVIAAVAMGARACLVGRAYLYGLMAGGERGVDRAAQILSSDMLRTMKLLGVCSISELTADHARLRPPPIAHVGALRGRRA
jgi:L-lactate dehydrogenase (cytochrome)